MKTQNLKELVEKLEFEILEFKGEISELHSQKTLLEKN